MTTLIMMQLSACQFGLITGPCNKDIYCHFKAEIYPNTPKETTTKLQWRSVIGSDVPKEFKPSGLQKYFYLNLKEYNDRIKMTLQEEKIRAEDRAAAILERRGEILRLPSHTEQKRGYGPNMMGGRAADGP